MVSALTKMIRELQGKTTKSSGGKNMEVKSRYEVISELEAKKNKLIVERESFADRIRSYKKDIRELERDVEDKKEELKDFEDSVNQRKETINELIKSTDDSLKRFSEMNHNRKN